MRLNARYHKSRAPIPLNGHPVVFSGASSVAGNEDLTGVTLKTLLDAGMPGSAGVYNTGIIGAQLIYYPSDVNYVNAGAVQGQIKNSASGGLTILPTATRIIQADANQYYLAVGMAVGGPEGRRLAITESSLTGCSNPLYTTNNVMDQIKAAAPTVISEGRFLFWVSTPNPYPDGWAYTGGGKNVDLARQTRLGWADYPGHFANALDTWRLERPLSHADKVSIDNGEAGFSSMRVVKADHLTAKGLKVLSDNIFQPFVESVEGGLPYFPFHHYYSNRSTAQTNGGYVTQLQYTGSLSGVNLRILNRDHSVNGDFSVATNGAIYRKTATRLNQGYYDLIVHAWSGSGLQRFYRIKLGIGSVDLSNDDTMSLDGNTYALVWSIDNAGTTAAPSYADNVSGNLRGISSTGQTECSIIFRISPTNDGTVRYLWSAANGLQISLTAANKIAISGRDDSAAPANFWAAPTPSATITAAGGDVWVAWSANVGGGRNRQQLKMWRDSDGAVLYDSGSVTIGAQSAGVRDTIKLNPVARTGFSQLMIFTGSIPGKFPAPSGLGTYTGKIARFMIFNQEIDWSVAENLSMFRSGPGVVTNLSVAAPTVLGDGRSFRPTAGVAGSYDGSVTALAPFFGLSGNAADFMHGLSIGTACALDGGEPGNVALVGGYTFEAIDKRDFQSKTSVVGIAVTTDNGATPEPVVSIANREHLTPEAQAFTNGVFLPAFGSLWAGPPTSGWFSDQLAASATDFFTKFNALDVTKHHRIRIAPTGDWTTGFVMRGKDFKANGGSCTVVPDTVSPEISGACTIQGVTNLDISGLRLTGTVLVNRQSTRPARPVIRFHDNEIGELFSASPTTWYSMPDHFKALYCDEVQFFGNKMFGSKNGPAYSSCRLVKEYGNDIQYTLGDTRDFNTPTDPNGGSEATQNKYALDPWCYFWSYGNVARNIVDISTVGTPLAATPPHTDEYQLGNVDDVLNYRCLFEFNVGYLERANFVNGTGTQGGYKDDTSYAIQCVEHSNVLAINAYSATGAMGGGTEESFTYSERNTIVRTAHMDGPVIDPDPRAFAFRLQAPTVGQTKLYLSNCLVGSIGTPADATIIQSNVVLANPNVASQVGATSYPSRFKGVFANDAQGRTSYTFDDSGADTPAEFRTALWAQFEPEDSVVAAATAPDPALWPV